MRIQLNNLKKCFGEHTAVDIPHFTIDNGQMVGLVGNNGAGKTTLFRLMLDLSKATEGNVLIDDIDPAKSEDWKLQTGAFIDNSFLIDFLTAEEYFEFVGKVSGMTREQVAERLKTFETFMGDEIMGQKKYIRDFSAGNKQKIGIIAAMLGRPQLLILDEPFNFLDPSSQHMLEQLLRSYCNETGATLLLSSHNLQHTIGVSSRIVLLEKGNIIKDLPNDNGNAEAELENYFCGQ